MTSTAERLPLPPGAVLVRVFAHGLSWARSLPVVPDGGTVTATVSDPRLQEVPADDLVSHGYRLAGVSAARPRGSGDVIDLLVLPEQRYAHLDWFRELLARADRAFDCDLGPVRRLLGAELALHVAAMDAAVPAGGRDATPLR